MNPNSLSSPKWPTFMQFIFEQTLTLSVNPEGVGFNLGVGNRISSTLKSRGQPLHRPLVRLRLLAPVRSVEHFAGLTNKILQINGKLNDFFHRTTLFFPFIVALLMEEVWGGTGSAFSTPYLAVPSAKFWRPVLVVPSRMVRRMPRLVRALKGYRDIQLNITSGTGCEDTIWQIVPIMTSLKRGRVWNSTLSLGSICGSGLCRIHKENWTIMSSFASVSVWNSTFWV